MATEVIMPQMGESIEEGTITKWLVQVGETVERDQPLFEISTDKVDAEIPSPEAGVLLEIRRREGETVSIHEVVGLIGEPGEELAPGEVLREAPSEDSSEKPSEAPTEVSAEEPAETPGETTEEAPAEADAASSPRAPASDLEVRVRSHSSPVVRKMAAEAGVDISRLEGTGIHGRVTKRDLESHLAAVAAGGSPAALSAPATISAPPQAPAAEAPDSATTSSEAPQAARSRSAAAPAAGFSVAPYQKGERVVVEPMSKIRQITAAHMRYSKDTSAHVSTVFHLDMSRIDRIRQRAKTGFLAAHGTKLTYMPFIFKAVANALVAHPKLNAAIDGTNVVFKKDINLGMAVALDWGLIVPVIRNADRLNLVGLAKTANELADRARNRRLTPDEIQGGTFTVTNPGVFGSLFGTPIINQPQVAILGIGTIEKRPIIETDDDGNDSIAIKTMSYFAITFDHRLVDGADADHFMIDLKRTLEEGAWNELDPYR